ncbi:MAG: YsnF/AvaK domain-containing protein, partial [Actinomycetota bacterium]
TFVTVNTGLFGTKESFVPADGARQDGDRLVLPYTKDVVKDAPNVDADQHLSPAEEEEIYRYYKMNYSGTGGREDRHATETDRSAAPAAGTAGYTRNDRYADDTAGRHDTAARADLDDNEVIRHEERLRVGKERQETGRARLRKYVVTEHETVDVPVQREEVRVERIPLDGTEVTGGTIGEDTVEVALHEERAVVAKETVGVEKIELEKETVRDTERVDAEVRKEQVEVETDAERGTGLTDKDRRDRI